MKIDRSKVKKGTSEVPEDCRKVIQFLKTCSDDELLAELQQINVWYFGKCELYHWIDVLDRFDTILAGIAKPVEGRQWIFQFDVLEDLLGKEKGTQQKNLIFQILKFTALLIEHSYARHLYNSIEHLITLLDCADGSIILAGLNLVYVFSKRSNYLSRLPSERKKLLQEKLIDLAQTWGGSEAGCALEQCCSEDVPTGAGNVYFEYYLADALVLDSEKSTPKITTNRFCVELKSVHEVAVNVGTIMENILKNKKIPENMQMSFYHRLRLAHAMTNYEQRLQFVQARLQALSVLVYSNATVHVNTLVYDGLIEEIVNTLKIVDNSNRLSEVKASCLKTLTAIIHLDRNPRLQSIIDYTGATSYHGFLPSLVRKCILHMTDADYEPFPQQLATSLFSFLYHLASYESGCESLVASGLIESLLKVVLWPGKDDHITFVTRAVRVIDLITNLDMAAFQTHRGLNALVGRLEREIKLCSAFHGPSLSSDLPLITPDSSEKQIDGNLVENKNHLANTSAITSNDEGQSSSAATPNHIDNDIEMTDTTDEPEKDTKSPAAPLQCLPQRAALLKSILNFLKKAIPDPAFADYTRSLMDENLQNALKLIISNAEYYGALLFLLATDVITVFIFHEPSLLSSLQDSGLTWVVLKALLVKDVPATRENLASLPNTLSALCLNTRGLEAFVSCKPFERLFQILVSPEYLPAMKRRRSSDPTGDTAMHLGSAMDELMRHQPTLKTDAMKAIIKLLKQLCDMGRNPDILAFHPTDKTKTTKPLNKNADASGVNTAGTEDPLSDDEMEEEYRSLLIRKSDKEAKDPNRQIKSENTHKKYVPVVDYVLNVTKFLDNILSNNGTDDHCVEFVRLGGLKPLYSLLNMPNFPLEFPLMPACQSIAPVCKSIAMLAQESKVFKEGLQQLDVLIDELESLYASANTSGSVLLRELAMSDNPLDALYDAQKTPLVHAMSAAHAYINTFVFICRGALSDVRNMSIQQWGSELGKTVLQKLCKLYTKLVWESSVLLTLCTPNMNADEDFSFADDDLQELTEKSLTEETSSENDPTSDIQAKKELTLLKWLLTSSSHLGRALAELFGLLVHQCVGTQVPRLRNRPHNTNQVVAPSIPAKLIASRLTKLLVQGLSWQCPKEIQLPRLRLTFYICSVGFSSPMLFDNSKNPYHLMLQQFQNVGGLDILFERFSWVVKEYLDGKNEEEIKSTVGIGEFFEGWLDLLNRMVNTKYVFDSTHALPTTSLVPGYVAFNALEYLTRVHKLAFESIMMLWKHKILKNAENRVIAEKLLSILCHIIKGEKELKEKYLQQHKQDGKKEKPNLMSEIQKTPAPTTFRLQQDLNEDYLQQFVDMGFSQQHSTDALIHSGNNFEVATEYLLTSTDLVLPTAGGSGGGMEVDISEEDMMMRAIAMSLGQSETREYNDDADSSERSLKKQKSEDMDIKPQPSLTLKDLTDFGDIITNHTDDIINGCLSLLDAVPSTVHTVCDLILVVSRRYGVDSCDGILNGILDQIKTGAESVNNQMLGKIVDDPVELKRLMKLTCEGPQVAELTTRLHLYLLMFQDIEKVCAQTLQGEDIRTILLELLELTTTVLKRAHENNLEIETPDLLAPLLLIIDHYERASLFWKRKQNQGCSHIWKWFDDRSGRWCNYSVSNNSSIDTAYHSGETTVRFTAGRRRYMVFFKTLVQINEDTGNRRPVMLDVLHDKKLNKVARTTETTETTRKGHIELAKELELNKSVTEKINSKATKRKYESEKQKMDIDKKQSDTEKEDLEIIGFYPFQKELIIESLVELLACPVNPATLNAVIRLLLRLTRDFEMASYFANRNGVENLLNLKNNSAFPGALPLTTLLLRHIVEDSLTLKQAVERAVSVAANNGVPNMFCGVGQNSLGAKELHYLLRALGSIACRNIDLYQQSIRKIIRLNVPNSRRNQLEEVIAPNTAQIVKVPQEFKMIGLSDFVPPNPVIKRFVHLLLKTLVERYNLEGEITSSPKITSAVKGEDKKKVVKEPKIYTPQATLVRRLTGEHIDEEDIAGSVTPPISSDGQNATASQNTTTAVKSNQPFLSQAVILRLLTELAKSYAVVACLVVEYHYSGSSSSIGAPSKKTVNNESILSFIFDHLLPHTNTDANQTAENKTPKPSTISTLARSLLAVLGAYWHNADIQSIFVTELKNALLRALHLPECKMKHLRLQAIFNLITSMIESAAPLSFTSQPPLQNSNFIKMMVKRGLISDLARCTHNLDLSSLDLVATVNMMLKPLEKLSNLANSQSVQGLPKSDKDTKQSANSNNSVSENNAETREAQAEESQQMDDGETGGDIATQDSIQNLEDIVEVMLGSDETQIFGETLISSHTDRDNGVEQRIYIEANPMVGNSDSADSDNSSDSDNDGGLSDNMSNEYPENSGQPMDEGLLGNSQSDGVGDNTQQSNSNQITEDSTNIEEDIVDTFDIISERHVDHLNDTHMEETFIMDREDEDDEENDGVLGGDEDDDDDDDTDDEDGNDDDDDDGSEMDADDTIAGADDAILFGEEDDATDDVTDPFADLDDQGGALEISFPRQPFAVHIPQLAGDDSLASTAQSRSSILSHPLLIRNNDQPPRGPTNQRPSRGRTNRGDRGFTRQGNTIHVHGGSNSGSFARILVGEDLRSTNRNFDPGVYTVGDDIFFDIFGDCNETGSGLLNSVPSALSRWTVESRLLDGSSIHDCVNSLKPDIISYLEKLQKEELKEKIAEEKCKKEENDKKKLQQKGKENTEKTTEVSSNLSTAESTTVSITTTTTAAVVAVSTVTSSVTQPATTVSALSIIPASSIPLNASAGTYRVVSSGVWTPPFLVPPPESDVISDYITPFNPLPDIQPNAPVRDIPATTGSTIFVTPAEGPSSDYIRNTASSIASMLGVVPNNTPVSMQTPNDVLRLNHMRTTNALTADLGFTPANTNTPQVELGNSPVNFTTPADVPSLQQLRSSLMFSHGSTPRVPIPRSVQESLSRVNVPSPLGRPDPSDNEEIFAALNANPLTTSATGSSMLASDLAAAIMSQLVTSSPTPVVTTAAQIIDGTSSSGIISSTTTDSVSSVVASTTEPNAPVRAEASTQGSLVTEPGPGPSGVLRAAEQIQRELEGLGIPEGVDPSFLAALPDSIREEVLREQFGIRLRTTQNVTTSQAASNSDAINPTEPQEVSPEFLAALPLEVQQEVLEQQRLEQARFTAAQQRPEQPVDPAEFVRNLNPTLRRQVLADMDDTVLAVLPPELSTEAQGLRREIEQRRMQIQADSSLTRSDFSQLLRHTGLAHRGPGGGFQFARLFPHGQMNSWRVTDGPSGAMGTKKVGRQLLDPESLTCLLVLLFLNDGALNASRLHRILRNLGYHNATKQWIILALISILRRTSSFHQDSSSSNLKNTLASENSFIKPEPCKKQGQSDNALCEEIAPSASLHNHWLSRTLNLAFGGCINIFQIQKVGKKSTDCFVTVHQQACLDVCKQTLEALSFLAKNFPASFAPLPETENKKDVADFDEQPGPSRVRDLTDMDPQSEFWDILVRLNSLSSGLKGKAPSKSLREFPKEQESSSFVTSPLGQILSMLSHPVVKQSTMLTDKLLRLLAVISMSLPERPKHLQARSVEVNHVSGPNARPPEDDAVLSDIPHPIHTVTFADTALSSQQAILPDQTSDYEREQNATDTGTVCSETTSVTSSLFVEPPELAEGRMMLPTDMRSPRAGSVMSAISDDTAAQSDISGMTAEHIHAEHDAMDVDNTSHTRSDTSSVDNRSSPSSSCAPISAEKEPAILIGQLRMAVNVLTSGTCSDEGMEDATTLLLQLSRTEPLTRDCILELLLEGAQEIASILRVEIWNLLLELKEHNSMNGSAKSTDQAKGSKQVVPVIINPTSARSQPWRGRGGRAANQSRRIAGFGGSQQARRNVPKPVIYDLHLSMMATLTAKRSSQSLFLRVLKVILQLRDAAKKFAKKPQATRGNQPRRGIRLIERLHHGGSNNLREFVAALEADMEAMYEMIDRFGAPTTRNQQSTQEESSNEPTTENSDAQPTNSDAQPTNSGAQPTAATGEASTSTDGQAEAPEKPEEPQIPQFPRLSTQLILDDLWNVLGETLTELAETTDTNAVLVLQPAVEAFFLVHGSEKEEEKSKESAEPSVSSSSLDIPPSPGPVSPGIAPSPSSSGRLGSQSTIFVNLPPDTQKFLRFAETHRTVLNQILRQSNNPLSDGPFAVLVNHTRLLDFDVKRRYFRQQLEKEDKGHRREDMAVHIRREHVFEDSYRELHRRTSEEVKNRLYIVFDGEEGQDAGGLLREWYGIMAREMFNPNYALFCISQGEKSTYLPNRNSHCNPNHLTYFKFAGRIVAKAIYDNKLLDSYFTRSFYKHILGKPVHYTDMEAEDYGFYQGLVYLLEHDISELGYELTFSLEMQVFGLNEVHDLKPNGRNIPVTEETKREYVKYVCQEKMTGSIRQQIDSFLEGFYEIIPRRLISIFDEQELELLIAGLPTIDIEDLKSNTEYHKYTENSLQVQWFWRALRSFEQADRAKFLQFVTGTSRVPLQGFVQLEGMNGVQKFQIHRDDRSTERLPCAHTCFNQLDLPAYETYDKLHTQLLKAIQECPEGFGLA